MLQGPKGQPSVAAALFGVQCVLPLAAGFTSSANPSATTYSCDARTLPETRVWGSKPENVHCSSATSPLKIELRWGCEESREKTAVGSGVSFKYDPFGRRIYKSSSSATSVYAYDGDNLVEETISSGAAVARYAQTENIDEPLAMLRSGTTSYYQSDGLNSITSLSSTAGALAQTYSFDSFGNQTAASGSITNSFRYTGREFDTESSLYYMRARYFDPATGRFIGEDPIQFGAGPNFYAYVGNNPIGRIDPLGLDRLKNLSDFSAGAGSVLSFGLTDLVNDATGASSVVDKCSLSHKLGTARESRYRPRLAVPQERKQRRRMLAARGLSFRTGYLIEWVVRGRSSTVTTFLLKCTT
jgi:RHS repeat-associated protein